MPRAALNHVEVETRRRGDVLPAEPIARLKVLPENGSEVRRKQGVHSPSRVGERSLP
jgi:hypothetical protein